MKMDINEFLKPNYICYAHIGRGRPETLQEHSNLTFAYYQRLKSTTEVSYQDRALHYFLELNKVQSRVVKELALELFDGAIYFHDIGKINRNFQILKMNNTERVFGVASGESHHSVYSALMYLHLYMDRIRAVEKTIQRHEKKVLKKLWGNFAYIISRHHGYLNNLNEFHTAIEHALDSCERDRSLLGAYVNLDSMLDEEVKHRLLVMLDAALKESESSPEENITFWLVCKSLYAYIVTCDFYATGHYMSGQETLNFGGVEDASVFCKRYYEDQLIQTIKSYNPLNTGIRPIDHLRSQMFLEAEKNFLVNKEENIFYLEAPTGCGKTLTSINLAVTALENCDNIKRVFYVFPFNTLVEQTYGTIQKLFDERNIAVVNSIEAIKCSNENKTDEAESYEKAYLDRIMLHYPITITSHVNFFSALTGASRQSHLMFSHLKDSIVIIDEIQSYKNMIWQELFELIHMAAKLFNIKFIIMSATLPNVSDMVRTESVRLITDPEVYFSNSIFKNRTVPDFHLLDDTDMPLDMDVLANEICSKMQAGKERILVEFIDKISAREFYDKLAEKYAEYGGYSLKELELDTTIDAEETPNSPYKIVEITGDDNNLYRNEIIARLKNKNEASDDYTFKKVVVIATQVIEAGIDIDMSIGYKDISLIDSEEQFAGRINRSCRLEKAPIYFFDKFDSKKIYTNDVRGNFSLKQSQSREWFRHKRFGDYFEKVLDKLKLEKQSYNKNGVQNFHHLLAQLDYLKLFQYLKLIDQESITIFIPQTINYRDADGQVKEIIGKKVWEQYSDLLNDRTMSYAQKQIELSKLKKEFSYFTYSVKHPPVTGFCNRDEDAAMGDNVYLLKENQYIKNKKFDRNAYNEANSKGILKAEDLLL